MHKDNTQMYQMWSLALSRMHSDVEGYAKRIMSNVQNRTYSNIIITWIVTNSGRFSNKRRDQMVTQISNLTTSQI